MHTSFEAFEDEIRPRALIDGPVQRPPGTHSATLAGWPRWAAALLVLAAPVAAVLSLLG